MKPLPAPTADTPTFAEIDAALDRLTPDAERRFGTMSPAQMLRHNRGFVDLYLGRGAPVSAPIRMIARLIGPMFLRKVVASSPRETPRGLRTLGPLRATDDGLDLDAERTALRSALAEAAALEGVRPHVLYGPMDAVSMQTLIRHHTAHHLNQFGLLD